MAAQFEYDVFISYCPKDRISAEDLAHVLHQRGLSVWRDDRLTDKAMAGSAASIKAAHEHSAKVLVLWSRQSLSSAWVLGEAERARLNRNFVPVALEPVAALQPFIPAQFAMLPALDITAESFDAGSLLRALGAYAPAPAAAGSPVQLMSTSVELSRLAQTFAGQLHGRDREMAALITAWDSQHCRILVMDAVAGAGKTALARHFAMALQTSGWRGARRVFAWSFPSTGTNESRETSTDEFFKAATHFFSSYTTEPPRDAREKGVVLAKLVQDRPALLILDGMEGLLHAAGADPAQGHVAGEVKDPGMRALLGQLAEDNPGLCLVTTRKPLTEMRGVHGVTQLSLDRLGLMAGIDLLRDCGVEPDRTQKLYKLPSRDAFGDMVPPWQPPAAFTVEAGDDRAPMPVAAARLLIGAVEDLEGHALALTLAAKYLTEHHQGDIRGTKDVPALNELEAGDPARTSYRVLRAIESALARRIEEQGQTEKPASVIAGRELALLLFLGFFDRPVATALLPVVFARTGQLKPDAADLALAATALDRVPDETALPEREQIRRRAVTEARRRLLFRRLFGGVHAIAMGELRQALGDLEQRGLVAMIAGDQSWDTTLIDCHPLVRSYFAARLKELDPASALAGHSRLYDYYRHAGLPDTFKTPLMYALLADESAYPEYGAKRTIAELLAGEMSAKSRGNTPKVLLDATSSRLRAAAELIEGPEWARALDAFLPATESGMSLLFCAIRHGCGAEREQETLLEVYRPRIMQGNRSFATHGLGLIGPQLAALGGYFEAPFVRPVSALSGNWQAFVLNEAGFLLRQSGRLSEAIVPMQSGAQLRAGQDDIENAATGYVNLSELLLMTGHLKGSGGALAAASQAVDLADQSGAAHRTTVALSSQACAYLAAGELAQAEAVFRQAEAVQGGRLTSLRGFQACTLLLARGRTREAAERAAQALTAARKQNWQLDIALAQLTQAQATPSVEATRAALEGLRRAGIPPLLPPALLAHAHALWQAGNPAGAQTHLAECDQICARGPLPLFAADSALLKARITLSRKLIARSLKYRNEAASLIEKHGFGRAVPELAVLDAEIARAEDNPAAAAKVDAAVIAVLGKAYRDPRTGRMIDGGWFGLRSRLEAVVPGTHPARLKLTTALESYDAERDDALEAGTDDGTSAEAVAGLAPDEHLPVTGKGGKTGNAPHTNGTHSIEEDEVPDADLDEILADPETCEALQAMLRDAGIETPIHDMPRDEQRAVVSAFLAAIESVPETPAKSVDVTGAALSDDYVRSVFADRAKHALLTEVMADNDLRGAPADLPFDTQREIVQLLIELGDIEHTAGPAGRNGVVPDGRPTLADVSQAARDAKAPPPSLDPALAPRKPSWTWWPFGKKAG